MTPPPLLNAQAKRSAPGVDWCVVAYFRWHHALWLSGRQALRTRSAHRRRDLMTEALHTAHGKIEEPHEAPPRPTRWHSVDMPARAVESPDLGSSPRPPSTLIDGEESDGDDYDFGGFNSSIFSDIAENDAEALQSLIGSSLSSPTVLLRARLAHTHW